VKGIFSFGESDCKGADKSLYKHSIFQKGDGIPNRIKIRKTAKSCLSYFYTGV